jgi:hypothetical protein
MGSLSPLPHLFPLFIFFAITNTPPLSNAAPKPSITADMLSIARLMRQMDLDRDGVVSCEEFIGYFAKLSKPVIVVSVVFPSRWVV